MQTFLTIGEFAGWALLVLACAAMLGYLSAIKEQLHAQVAQLQAIVVALETCMEERKMRMQGEPDEEPERERAASPSALRRDSERRRNG